VPLTALRTTAFIISISLSFFEDMRESTQVWTLSEARRLLGVALGVCGILAACGILAGCGKGGTTLEYPEAINLLRENNTSGITMSFSSTPPDRTTAPMVSKAYDQLQENHVLDCSGQTNLCVPGAAGGALRQDSATELVLTAGHWAPGNISSIQRTSTSTAVAQVQMSFEPSPLYHDFENAFDALRTPGSSRDLDQKVDGKTMTATFQRLEDGWHLESLQ